MSVEELNSRLKQLKIEDFVWIIYIGIIFMSWYSNYFERHGGYKFAKEFYEKAFHFAEIEMGTENIISAVMHAPFKMIPHFNKRGVDGFKRLAPVMR